MDRHTAAVRIQVRACCLAFLHKRRASLTPSCNAGGVQGSHSEEEVRADQGVRGPSARWLAAGAMPARRPPHSTASNGVRAGCRLQDPGARQGLGRLAAGQWEGARLPAGCPGCMPLAAACIICRPTSCRRRRSGEMPGRATSASSRPCSATCRGSRSVPVHLIIISELRPQRAHHHQRDIARRHRSWSERGRSCASCRWSS
jgi:hypothetical protein